MLRMTMIESVLCGWAWGILILKKSIRLPNRQIDITITESKWTFLC